MKHLTPCCLKFATLLRKKAFRVNEDEYDQSRELCSSVQNVNYANTYLKLNKKINQSATMKSSITPVYNVPYTQQAFYVKFILIQD